MIVYYKKQGKWNGTSFSALHGKVLFDEGSLKGSVTLHQIMLKA